MPTVAFITLGCKVNQFDTEIMEGLFKQRCYDIVPFDSAADVYVVNTCSVTHLGEKKSRQLIRRAHRHNPAAIVAVTGCYAQLDPAALSAIEGVAVLIGTKDRSQIVDLVETAAAERLPVNAVSDIMAAEAFEDIPLYNIPDRARAFLKIQEGCANFCTYCIIPYTRGPLRSRRLDSVKTEAARLVEAGFKELVLTGIHLGTYGRDLPDGVNLDDAVQAVLSLDRLRRLRLGSLESIELTPCLLNLMQAERRLCRHLHLPLQAGHDDILKAMNRHYTTAEYKSLIGEILSALPDAAISTDVIVGFPGETDTMFQEALEFIESVDFARIHVFPFSARQGTAAAKLPEQIDEAVKKRRAQLLTDLAERKTAAFTAKFIGQTMPVLLETVNDGIADGLTGNYIRVYVAGDIECGEIYDVKLEKTYKDGVLGKLCK